MLKDLLNIDAEQAVLASLIYDPDCAGLAAELTAEDFGAPEHAEIFSWLAAEIGEGRKPTAMAIMPLMASKTIGSISGREYIVRLMRAMDPPSIRESVALLRVFAVRRHMSWIGDVLKDQAMLAGNLPRDVCIDAIKALTDAIAIERKQAPASQLVGEIAYDLVATLDDPDDGSMISTGLKSLDRFMGGWPRGELSIVAGRPSMGKSALLSALARRAAKKSINLMFFSLEMPRKAVVARMLSDFAYSSREDLRIPYADILRKNLSQMQRERLRAAVDVFHTYPIRIDDQRGLTVPEIQVRAMRYADELDKEGRRLDVVIVDHLGKIKSSDRYRGNVTAETTEKSDSLMTMSYGLDSAVIAACQLNRGTEGREDKHPGPSDLRDSGALEQDAHTLVFPYRQSYYLERQKFDDQEKDRVRIALLENKKNALELLIPKCRNGGCGNVDVFVDMASNHVEDLLHAA